METDKMETELITSPTDVAFADIRSQLATVAEDNRKLVFDYATEEGEKAAKKQVRDLRKLDKKVSEIHTRIKKIPWEQCKMIDKVKRDLVEEIAKMVDVHKKPLEAKRAAEAKRVQAIADKMALIVSYDDKFDGVLNSVAIAEGIATLEAIEVTADFDERMAEATTLKESVLADLNVQLGVAKKSEADAAELAELRRQNQEREREERESRIAEKAAETARIAAEEKAAKEKREAEELVAKEKREAEENLQAEKDKAERESQESAERERLAVEAKEKAENDAKEAKAKAKKDEEERQAKAKKKAAADEAKRLSDEKHVETVKQKAAEDLVRGCGVSLGDGVAAQIVQLIADKKISSVSIKF